MHVRRTDHPAGWGQNLQIHCCVGAGLFDVLSLRIWRVFVGNVSADPNPTSVDTVVEVGTRWLPAFILNCPTAVCRALQLALAGILILCVLDELSCPP